MKSTIAIEEYIIQKSQIIDDELEKLILNFDNAPKILKKSILYSLSSGKRIRPLLLIIIADILGTEINKSLPFACAIEMIHTYSLIHDDLPCMDNDDYRRGKLSNHKVFGEAQAILAGDALLTESFSLIASGFNKNDLSRDKMIDILNDVSKYTGARGMIGGQVDDTNLSKLNGQNKVSLKDLDFISKRKTADLFVLSVRLGAYLSPDFEKVLSSLTIFANNLGLAFQIKDDILDYSKDLKKNPHTTYPAILGIDESEQKLIELTLVAKNEINNISSYNFELLLQFCDYLLERGK